MIKRPCGHNEESKMTKEISDVDEYRKALRADIIAQYDAEMRRADREIEDARKSIISADDADGFARCVPSRAEHRLAVMECTGPLTRRVSDVLRFNLLHPGIKRGWPLSFVVKPSDLVTLEGWSVRCITPLQFKDTVEAMCDIFHTKGWLIDVEMDCEDSVCSSIGLVGARLEIRPQAIMKGEDE